MMNADISDYKLLLRKTVIFYNISTNLFMLAKFCVQIT